MPYVQQIEVRTTDGVTHTLTEKQIVGLIGKLYAHPQIMELAGQDIASAGGEVTTCFRNLLLSVLDDGEPEDYEN